MNNLCKQHKEFGFYFNSKGELQKFKGCGVESGEGAKIMNIVIRCLFLMGGWCRVYITVLGARHLLCVGPGERAIHKTWKNLEAGEQLETAAVIPEEAWRLEQETKVILAVVGRKEAGRLEVELRGVGDGI